MLRTDWSDGENVDAIDLNGIGQAVNALSGVVTKTTAYTLSVTDRVVAANATAASFTLTLPDAVANTGKQYTIKKVDSTVNTVTVATTSSQTIDSMPSALLVFTGQRVTVASDGANWIAVEANYVGTELGYAELLTPIPTVNYTVSDIALAASKVPGLSITTIGAGRPVQVKCCAQAYNTTVNAVTGLSLLTNGSGAGGVGASVSSPDTTARSFSFEANPVLVLGTSYTFEVAMWCAAGSQGIYYADSSTPMPMFLSVVGK